MPTITLPYDRPPLRPNERPHWAQKARITRQIRQTSCALAKIGKIGPQPRSVVTAVWYPRDRRRRDAGSLTVTLKAAIDGLVDAGVWPDDDPSHVAEERVRVEPGPHTHPRIEIRIEETP